MLAASLKKMVVVVWWRLVELRRGAFAATTIVNCINFFPSLRYQLPCTDHGLDLIAVKCYFQGLNFFEVHLSHDVFSVL